MSKRRTRVEALNPSDYAVPVSAFNKELTPLETIVVYLKDEYLLNYVAIASLIARDPREIGTTYRRAKKKGDINHKGKKIKIPISQLQDRTQSPAEHVAKYLYQRGLTYAEIGRQLEKDQRSIWTLVNRKKTTH